ncbi:uncharacterized protein B0H64DRAFT_378510 [Chaetomium fimeti]|uniref:Uncharacterized protein n=1 Tax=Chaetomium fimeti TaxID=1854472 RepID=A0AAE0H695_9PEZI|nr:hypothetical protein B0H64DRAFT_378510 [Chaetomium fimeti]
MASKERYHFAFLFLIQFSTPFSMPVSSIAPGASLRGNGANRWDRRFERRPPSHRPVLGSYDGNSSTNPSCSIEAGTHAEEEPETIPITCAAYMSTHTCDAARRHRGNQPTAAGSNSTGGDRV